MAVHRSEAVVLSRRNLGEADRLVEFYSRDFGKVRGVAKGARRPRSRLAGALEPPTLGALVFFDTGRSDLVRIDHFDTIEPFVRVREDLVRLGAAAWALESVTRLTAERDPQPALFGLVLRALRAMAGRGRPERAAACFALRAMDLLGHRPRLDRCVGCGRAHPFPDAGLDVTAGGLVCGECRDAHAIAVSGALVGTLKRLRGLAWEEGLRLPLAAPLDAELSRTVEVAMAHLAGAPSRVSRFIAQTRRGLSVGLGGERGAAPPQAPPPLETPRRRRPGSG